MGVRLPSSNAGKLILLVIGVIVAEKLLLRIIDNHLRSHQAEVVQKFREDIEHHPLEDSSECREYPIAFAYDYKVCASPSPRFDCSVLMLGFTAGYLTLVPRDYADRIVWDGMALVCLKLEQATH